MFYEGSYNNVVNYRISRICPIISKFLNWKYKWRCSRILPFSRMLSRKKQNRENCIEGGGRGWLSDRWFPTRPQNLVINTCCGSDIRVLVTDLETIFLIQIIIFSSAHFGRTLESTLSVTHVMMMMAPLLNWVICPNIFILIV